MTLIILLLCAGAVMLAISRDGAPLAGLTHDQFAGALFFGLVALFVASSLRGLFAGRMRAALEALAIWVALLIALVTGYSYRYELGGVVDRVMAELSPGTAVPTAPNEMSISRAMDGQFVVAARVDGQPVRFIFDTGASAVVLRAEDAARVGIDLASLRFTVMVSTANGRAQAAEASVRELAIGTISERDVRVLVTRRGAMRESLLGMSFLDRLESFTVQNGRLILRGN